MSFAPKTRNRLGITPFDYKPSDIDTYDGFPFRPYPEYERITPRDLVQMLENNFLHLWRECVPFEVPQKYQGLKTIANDELWENHPDNGIGYETQDRGERAAPVYVKQEPKKAVRKPHYSERCTTREEKAIMRKFYPGIRI